MQDHGKYSADRAKRTWPSLEQETRAAVETECAAFHLSREPQTLRVWACNESGPLRPIRVNGRLAWPTSELRRVLCMGAEAAK